MLTTIDPSVRGKTDDALVVGHLVLMNGVNADNARAVPSVSISQSTGSTVEQAVEDVQSTFKDGDMHVTVVKTDEALETVKQNLERMRSGLSTAAIDDHVVVWSGDVPTFSQKQTPVKVALTRANACTILPMGIGRNSTILRHVPERKMGSFAFVYPIDGTSNSMYWSWWLWMFVFVFSLIMIISFSVRSGKKQQQQPIPTTQQQTSWDVFKNQ